MSKIYLSSMAGKPLIEFLKSKGYSPIFTNGKSSPLKGSVATHPDMYICQLGTCPGSPLFFGDVKSLGCEYPSDIIYNAVCTEKYFIHSLKHTSRQLLEKASGRIFVNVPQGYTRCCCLPVDDSSFITSDVGIASALDDAGANVLLIDKGFIKLKGFDYGFIGGCAGKVIIDARAAIIFNGDLCAHPNCIQIINFLYELKIKTVFFSEYALEDIGSIIPK